GVKNHFEDNYFDLLPKQPKSIHVETGISLSEFKEQLKIQSFN
ncbi:MAG: hypothetical protein HUK15_00185, partial [Bacteroidales bacterium]|nr:hypothetical protein [Bacteroidales bacterium]